MGMFSGTNINLWQFFFCLDIIIVHPKHPKTFYDTDNLDYYWINAQDKQMIILDYNGLANDL